MDARYADGRAAVTKPASFAIADGGLDIEAEGVRLHWTFDELRRADDSNGLIILKRHPDTGERLILDQHADAALRAAAPALFTPQAQGVEKPSLVMWLAGATLSVAAIFLIGVPILAEPIARVLPQRYQDQVATIARAQLEGMTTYCESDGEAELALDDLVLRFIDESPSRDDDALRSRITVTLVHAPFPNAFALPDDSIVVTDQLIAAAEHPDELAGVLAHELAHISHRHVMANVIRNIGAGVFFDVIFGGAGIGQVIAVASVNLAALGYSREAESEADRSALDYLDNAGIDPAALSRFFDRIAEISGESDNHFPTMLSSHPNTAERAAAARERAHTGRAPALSAYQWNLVRTACGGEAQTNPEQSAPPGAPATGSELGTAPATNGPPVDKGPAAPPPKPSKPR